MLLIDHSMGGLPSRARVSRIDSTLTETMLPGVCTSSDYNWIRRALLFEPRPDVSRAVFPLRPHRGSRLAANGLGALAIHSIIGNRGRGDGSAGADGVVPVRSAGRRGRGIRIDRARRRWRP
jgi:hypothetical protein